MSQILHPIKKVCNYVKITHHLLLQNLFMNSTIALEHVCTKHL